MCHAPVIRTSAGRKSGPGGGRAHKQLRNHLRCAHKRAICGPGGGPCGNEKLTRHPPCSLFGPTKVDPDLPGLLLYGQTSVCAHASAQGVQSRMFGRREGLPNLRLRTRKCPECAKSDVWRYFLVGAWFGPKSGPGTRPAHKPFQNPPSRSTIAPAAGSGLLTFVAVRMGVAGNARSEGGGASRRAKPAKNCWESPL